MRTTSSACARRAYVLIYNHMVVDWLTDERADRVFHALADATRRDIVVRTLEGEHSVSALARRYPMSFAGTVKVLFQLNVGQGHGDLFGKGEHHVSTAGIHGVEQVRVQRREICRETTHTPTVPYRELGDAEIDVELFELQGVRIDAITEAALLGRKGAAPLHTAGSQAVARRRAVRLVNFQREDTAQIVAGEKIEE